jgi:hypothetical protein
MKTAARAGERDSAVLAAGIATRHPKGPGAPESEFLVASALLAVGQHPFRPSETALQGWRDGRRPGKARPPLAKLVIAETAAASLGVWQRADPCRLTR